LSPSSTTIRLPRAKSSASDSASAMPPAVSCTRYVNWHPKRCPEPSEFTMCPMCSVDVTMSTSRMPTLRICRTACQIIGSRPTGSRCLFVTSVSGARRVPLPPARMTPLSAVLESAVMDALESGPWSLR